MSFPKFYNKLHICEGNYLLETIWNIKIEVEISIAYLFY